jgi:hypothetical protein
MQPLTVGRELPDADAIRARIERLDEERALLRKLLNVTIDIQASAIRAGADPIRQSETAHAARQA